MTTASPSFSVRFAVFITSIAVLATACGSDPDAAAPDGAEDGADEADSADEASEGASLGDPGILAVHCLGGELVATLSSEEDGSTIVSKTFSWQDLTGEEVPDFPAGRAAPDADVSLPVCSEDGTGYFEYRGSATQVLIPDAGVLLVDITEEVDGDTTRSVGALDAEGNVSALTEQQEGGDEEDPLEFSTARYHATEDRVLYLEHEPESGSTGTFHEIALDTGEQSEAFECATSCDEMWIDQPTGLLSWTDNPVPDSGLIMSPDGGVVMEPGSQFFWNVDSPTALTYGLPEGENALQRGDIYFDGSLVAMQDGGFHSFISDTEMVMSDDELSVIDVDESAFSNVDEGAEAGQDMISESYTLFPDGTRTDSEPLVSADGREVVFLAETESDDLSWFRVPVDGSEEPTEIGPLEFDGVSNPPIPIGWH